MAVAVLGGAMTPFGERDASLLELFVEAGRSCLADAGLEPAAVDRLVTTQSGGSYENRAGLASAVARRSSRPPDAGRVTSTSSKFTTCSRSSNSCNSRRSDSPTRAAPGD